MQGIDPQPERFLPELHRWLFEARLPSGQKASVIVDNLPDPADLATLCSRLNLCLDGRGTMWLGFGENEIDRIAADPASLALLGVATCANCPPAGPCGRRKIIRALAGHGAAVFSDPFALQALADQPGVLLLRHDPLSGLISLAGERPADLPTFLADLVADYLEARLGESAHSRATGAEPDGSARTTITAFPSRIPS